jgi:hypothetical protein
MTNRKTSAVARSLDADWPPRQPMTLTELITEARAVDWDFAHWCYANGHDASDPDARNMFERLLAYARREGRPGFALTGRFADSSRCAFKK